MAHCPILFLLKKRKHLIILVEGGHLREMTGEADNITIKDIDVTRLLQFVIRYVILMWNS